jgi:hypothetical protein
MTGHKSIAMYLRYVHPDQKRIRKSADKVSARRRKLVGITALSEPSADDPPSRAAPASRTARGNYRPYRKRKGENREPPPANNGALSNQNAAASQAEHVERQTR